MKYDSDNPLDVKFIEFINCLIHSETDETLITIKLSIFIRLATIIREDSKLESITKKTLLIQYASTYCDSYVDSIYRNFIYNHINKTDDLRKFIEGTKMHKNIYQSVKNIKDMNIEKFYNCIGLISYLSDYINTNSTYEASNNTMFDYLSEVINLNDPIK